MKLQFLDVKTSIKSHLNAIVAVLSERRGLRQIVLEFNAECLEEEESDSSTQFLQAQKNQLIDLHEHLERYCNVFQSLISIVPDTTLTLYSTSHYPYWLTL